MPDARPPGPWARMAATLGGEVPGGMPDASRRAGGPVDELLAAVEQRRADLARERRDAWSVDPATQAFLLCGWNAFALQLLGDRMLEAADPGGRPADGPACDVTRKQALAFHGQVEDWVRRGRHAEADPTYRLDVEVPAGLPGWIQAAPGPPEHLAALLAACRELRPYAEVAFADLERDVPAARQEPLGRLRRQLAAVTAAATYAEWLHQQDTTRTVRRIQEKLETAIDGAYRLGQLVAMPGLLDAQPRGHARAGRPGDPTAADQAAGGTEHPAATETETGRPAATGTGGHRAGGTDQAAGGTGDHAAGAAPPAPAREGGAARASRAERRSRGDQRRRTRLLEPPTNEEEIARFDDVPFTVPRSVAAVRAFRRSQTARYSRSDEPVARIRDHWIYGPGGALRVRVYMSDRDGPVPILLWFHSGGWVTASVDDSDGLCRAIANRLGVVVSVDYRLAPEHRFPAAVEDCWEALRWASAYAGELGGDGGGLAVGGGEVGANLAAVVARRARDQGGPPLAYQLLWGPVLDATATRSAASPAYGLAAAARLEARWGWSHYLGSADGTDPDASAAHAGSVAGLPPALIVLPSFNPFQDQADAYAQRLAGARVPVATLRYRWRLGGAGQHSDVLDEVATALRDTLPARGPDGGHPRPAGN
jgi:acetyl esterase